MKNLVNMGPGVEISQNWLLMLGQYKSNVWKICHFVHVSFLNTEVVRLLSFVIYKYWLTSKDSVIRTDQTMVFIST